jgi:hypothetical protein
MFFIGAGDKILLGWLVSAMSLHLCPCEGGRPMNVLTEASA